MENWGGITYYETALLFDPANSSAGTKQRVYEVIAHEVAHQWFGDLVTMAWWDNLWLNEGFASWMGTKCTAHFNPQWEVWLEKSVPRDPARRIGIVKETAMEGDARATTHSIQQKVANEAEANSAFDDITYKKDGPFCACWKAWAKPSDGIRRYIPAHKYSNSTTAIYGSVEPRQTRYRNYGRLNRAAGFQSNVNGKPWRSLSQERFTIDFHDNLGTTWKIPLSYFIDGQSAPATRCRTKRRRLKMFLLIAR